MTISKPLLKCCLFNILSLSAAAFNIRNVNKSTTWNMIGGSHSNGMMASSTSLQMSTPISQGDRNSAFSSKIGLSRTVNQDRALIVSPFKLEGETGANNFITGVFDGHGKEGEQWAEFASQSLPTMLSHALEKQSQPWDAAKVTDSFTSTFRKIHEEGPAGEQSGSTASVALRLENMLYLANVGDSMTFVVTWNTEYNARTIHQTTPHKPGDPIERARIEQHGGIVCEVSNRIDIDGGKDGLAMSRTLGDRDTNALGVIPDPTVVEIDLSTLQDPKSFVVSVTGGLFKKVPLPTIALRLGYTVFDWDKSADGPRKGCESLVDKAWEEWNGQSEYTWGIGDDITIVVHMLYPKKFYAPAPVGREFYSSALTVVVSADPKSE